MLRLLLPTVATALQCGGRAAPHARAIVPTRGPVVAMATDNDQGVEYAVTKSDAEWRDEMDANTFAVLRNKGTERPGTSQWNKFYPKTGHFQCAAPSCAQPLYSAQAKFDSGCGWPAFDKIVEGAVVTATDNSMGMKRVEIMCAGCGGHLGHVFENEGFTPTLERHCVNGVAMKYVDEPLPEGTDEVKVIQDTQTDKKEETKSDILSQLLGDKD